MLLLSGVVSCSLYAVEGDGLSLPQNYEIEVGNIDNIRYPDANSMILEVADGTIINWKDGGFNVPENASVGFEFSSGSGNVLNRDQSTDISQIMGNLWSNGTLFLVNESGIYVGPTARIDSNNLILSTRDITTDNFRDGEYLFQRLTEDESDRILLNEGNIVVAEGGFGVLIAGAVENRGVITAKMGTIALASGDAVKLELSADGLISVAIEEPVARTITDYEGNPITDQIKNTGTLDAEGGRVILNAESINNIFTKAINLEGIVKGTRLEESSGLVKIVADGDIRVAANVEATRIEIGKTEDIEEVELDVLEEAEEVIIIASDQDAVADEVIIEEVAVVVAEEVISIVAHDYIKVGAIMEAPNVILRSNGGMETTEAALIQAQNITLLSNKFGSYTKAFTLDGTNIHVERLNNYIKIVESTGVGTTILMRGPPEGWGAILLNKDSNLTLKAEKVIIGGDSPTNLYGNITFHNFECTIPGKEIYFEAGSTYIFKGNTYIGYDTEDCYQHYPIYIESSEEGNHWYIDVKDTYLFTLLAVQDSYNLGEEPLRAHPALNKWNNINWNLNSLVWDGSESSAWSNTDNWTPSGDPTNQDLEFTSGSVASQVDATITIASLTINGYTGTITHAVGAYLTITGVYSQATGTHTNSTSAGTTFGDDVTITGGTFDGGGFCSFDGTTDLTTGGETFENIHIDNGASVTLKDTTTLRTGVTCNSATLFDITNQTVNSGGDFNLTNLTTFTSTGSTVVLNGTADQTLFPNSKIFNHLTLNNTGSAGNDDIVVTGDLDVDGTLTITDGVLDLDTNDPDVYTAGNVTIQSNGSITSSSSGTWYLNGAADQTVTTNAQTFNNLTLNNTGTDGSDDIIISGNLDVNGTLTITNGDLDLDTNDPYINTAGDVTVETNGSFTASGFGGSEWIFDGTTNLTSNGQSLVNVQIGTASASGTLNLVDTADISATIIFNTTGGTVTLNLNSQQLNYSGVSTVDLTNCDTFTGTGTFVFDREGDQALTTAGKTFDSLTLNNTGSAGDDDLEISGDLDVNGTLTITDGDLDLATNSVNLYTAGDVTIASAGSYTAAPTDKSWYFDGTTSLTSNSEQFSRIDIGTGSAGGTLNLVDDLDVNDGIFFGSVGTTTLNLNSQTLNYSYISLDFTNCDTFTGTGTFVFDGSTDQTITTNSKTFDDLTLNNTGGADDDDIIISGSLDVNGTLTITNGELDLDTNNVTVNAAGDVTVGASGSINSDLINTLWIFDGTTNLTSGGELFENIQIGTDTASGSLTLVDEAYLADNGFSFNTTGGTVTLDLNSQTLNYSLSSINFTNCDTFTGTGTFVFDYAGTVELTSADNASKAFQHVTIANGTTLQLQDTADFDGNLTCNATATAFTITDKTLNVGGNFNLSNLTTFNSSGSTVILDGIDADQTLTNNSKTFNHLTLNNTGASPNADNIVVVGTLDVNGTLTITDGDLDINTNSNNVYAAGDVTVGAVGSIDSSSSGAWFFDGTTDLTSNGETFDCISIGTDVASGSLTLVDTCSSGRGLAFDTTGGTTTLNLNSQTMNNPGANVSLASCDNFTGTGTFVLNGAEDQAFTTNSKTFDNLTLNNTGTNGSADNIIVSGNIDVNGILTITDGDLDINTNGIIVYAAGNVTVGASGSIDSSSNGGWFFDGTTNLTSAGQTFSCTTIGSNSASGTLNLVDTLNVDRGMSFNTTGGTVTLNLNSQILNYSAGSIDFTNCDNFTETGTFVLNGTTDQTLTTGSETFDNFTINNTGAADSDDIIISGDLDVNGTLTITNGDLDLDVNDPDVYTAGDVTIGASGSLTFSSSGTWYFDGTTDLTSNSQLFDCIQIGSGTAGGTLNLIDRLNVNDNIGFDTTVGTTTLDMSSQILDYAGIQLIFTNCDTFIGLGTFIFDRNGTTSLTSADNGSKAFDAVTIGTGSVDTTLQLLDAADFDGDLTFGSKAGSDLNLNSQTLNFAGSAFNLTNCDTFTGTGTLVLNAAADQTITTNSKTFDNLTLNNTGAADSDDIVISGNLDVNGTLTITDGDLDLNTNDDDVWTAGDVTVGASGSIDVSVDTVWYFDGTTSLTSNGQVFQNVAIGTESASGSLTLVDTANIDDSFSFNSNGGTVTLNLNSQILNYSSNSQVSFTNCDNFTGTGTFVFDGTTDQSMTTASKTFDNLTLNNTGAADSDDIVVSGALDVNGTLLITDGDLDLGTNNPNVNTAGTVTIGASGSVTKGTGTWTFDGDLTYTDNTGSDINIGTVVIGSSPDEVTLGSNFTADSLTINADDSFITSGYNVTLTDFLTIAADGTLNATTAGGRNSTITVAGNWANSGTFTQSTSTVIFNNAAKTTAVSGSTTFNNLTCNTASKNITFVNGTTQTISGTLTLNGQATGTKIVLNSDDGTNRFNIQVASATTVNFVDVSNSEVTGDSGNDITAEDSTDTSNNDTGEGSPAWIFGSGITISGTLYDGALAYSGDALTLALYLNGTSTDTTTTTDGSFSFSNITIAANDAVLLFIDGDATYDANLVSVAVDADSNISSLSMYMDRVGLRHETAGPMTNTILDSAGISDADVFYSISSSDATFSDGYNLWIPASMTYTPGGAVTIGGDLLNEGTFTPSTNAVTFNGTGSFDITSNSATFDALTFNNAGGDWTLQDALDVNGNLTISAGELILNGQTINIAGNWVNSATFTSDTGTVIFDKTSGTQTLKSGGTGAGNLFNDLTHSGAGTLQLVTNDLDVDGDFVNSDGTFDSNNLNMNFAKGWTNSGDAVFTRGSGTLTLDGTTTLTDSSSNAGNLGAVAITGTTTLGSDATLTSNSGAGTLNLGAGSYTLTLSGTGSPMGVTTFNKGTGSTVVYTGSGTATNIGTVAYNNLTLTPTSATTYSLTGNLTGGNALSGDVTINNNATLDADNSNNYNLTAVDITINSGGTYLARGSSIGVSGNWTTNGTFTAGTSTVTFNGSSGQTITGGTTWNNLTIANTHGTADVDPDSTQVVTGTLTVNDGIWTPATGDDYNDVTIGASGSIVPDSSASITVSGDWTNNGGFTHSNSNVTFDTSSTATIAGTTTFYDFSCSTAGKTIKFTDGTEQTIASGGTFSIRGAAGNRITLQGTGAGTWDIDVTDTQNVYNVAVYNSDANTSTISCYGDSLDGGGNNANWIFNVSTYWVGTNSNWSDGGNWATSSGGAGGAGVPGSDDYTIFDSGSSQNSTLTANVTVAGLAISSGYNGTVNTSTYTLAVTDDLSIAGGTLNASSGTLDVGEQLSMSSGTFTAPGAGKSFTIAGNLSVTGGTFNNSSGTLTFDASDSDNTIKTSGADLYDVTFSSGSYTLQDALDVVENDLTISSGATLDASGNDITLAGDWDNDGTFTANSNTVTFNGSAAQAVSGATTWANLTIANTAAPSDTNDVDPDAIQTVTNTLTVSDGQWTPFTGDDYASVVIGANGSIVPDSNASITVSGDWDNDNGGTFTHNGSTVTFDGSGVQAISGVNTWQNLTINNSSGSPGDGSDVDPNAAQTVANTLTVTDGQWTPFTGDTYKDVTIEANGVVKPDLNASISVSGNWDNDNSGTFAHNNSTVDFNGTSGTQTLDSGGDAFNNISHSEASTVQLDTNNLTVAGTLTNSAGTFDVNDLTITVIGDTAISGGTYNTGTNTNTFGNVTVSGGTVNIESDATDSDISIGGTWTNSGGTIVYKAATVVSTNLLSALSSYNNLEINSSDSTYTLDGAIDVDGNLTITAGTLDASASNYAITLAGNWTNDGGFTSRSGTVTFDGSAAQTIVTGGTGGTQDFYDLTIANTSANVSLSTNALDIDNDLTINSGATFDLAGNDITVGNSFSNSGTLRVQGGETVTGLTPLSTTVGTIEYYGSGTTGLAVQYTYFNLTFTGTGTWTLDSALTVNGTLSNASGVTVDMAGYDLTVTTLSNSGTIKLKDTETVTITTMNYDAGTFEYYNTASGSQTGLVAGNRYYNITFTGSGSTWALDSALDVDGTLTINSGVTLNAAGYTINAAKGWANSGTFTHGNNEVVFDTTDDATITGDTTFYDLTCQTGGKTMTFAAGSTQTVTNLLTIEGSGGNLIRIVKDSGTGSHWYIDPPDARADIDVEYVYVQDSYNLNRWRIDPPNSTNGGNNRYWFAGPDPPPVVIIIDDPMDLAVPTGFVFLEDEEKKYKKLYASGKYRTTVIVFEGRVVVAEYGEEGVLYEEASILTGGQSVTKEGAID